jgi:chemotaxis protein MotC
VKRKAILAAVVLSALLALGGGGYFALRAGFLSAALEPVIAALGFGGQHVHDTAEAQKPYSGADEIVASVRELGLVQDRIATGDANAVAAQYETLKELSKTFRDLPQDAWADRRVVQALLVYVLSGGQADAIATFLKAVGDGAHETADLARGIQFFKEQRAAKALPLLARVSPRSLDQSLVGPYALAMSSLVVRQSPVKALSLLDEARLQSPNTAIEEAATRWQIPLLLNQGDLEKAVHLTGRYFRVFGASLYAGQLRENFASLFANKMSAEMPRFSQELFERLANLSADVRGELFLSISRYALLAGKIDLAESAARAVLSLKPESTSMIRRAELYLAAARSPSEDAAAALEQLNAIGRDGFGGDDAEVHTAAGKVARSIVAPRVFDGDVSFAVENLGGEPDVVHRTQTLLKHVDQLIAGEHQ